MAKRGGKVKGRNAEDEGYLYDVFISYKRASEKHGDATELWVGNHLVPQLRRWLPQELKKGTVDIFHDVKSIEVGAHWPTALRDGLDRSRCMIAVLSPPYFTSSWCLAEFETMLERTRRVSPDPVLVGVVYNDGTHFPPTVVAYKHYDLHEWNYPEKAYGDSPAYLAFVDQMKRLCADLAKKIEGAPPWKKWPTKLPKRIPKESPITTLPRPRR